MTRLVIGISPAGPCDRIGGELSDIRRKPSSFEEYWLASKAWERKGLPLSTGRALANAGFLKVDDLHSAHDLELATIPRVGRKSLAILYGLMGRMQGALEGARLTALRSGETRGSARSDRVKRGATRQIRAVPPQHS
jgi:hypothetical protein